MKLSHSFLITTSPKRLSNRDERLVVLDIPTEIVADYDYRTLSLSELEERYEPGAFGIRYGCFPSPGAIGCAAAHRHCYEAIVRDNGDCALIMEDDYRSDGNLDLIVSRLIDIQVEWDVISLKITNGIFHPDPIARHDIGNVYTTTVANYGTYAYLIKRKAAVKMLEKQSPKIQHLSDWPLEAWQFKLLGLHTHLGGLTDRQSTVQQDFRSHPSKIYQLLYRVRKFMYRLRRAYRLKVCKDIIIDT